MKILLKSKNRKSFSFKLRGFSYLIYDLKYNKALLVMLSMPLILLIVFQYIPMIGLQIAFRDYKMFGSVWEAEWVGLKYFFKFFEYHEFNDLLKNTILLNSYDLLLSPLPLVFALCLNYFPNKKIRSLIQTISISPHFISTVVVCSVVIRLLSIDGPINQLRESMGLEQINFLTNGELFRSIYVWSGAWQTVGFNSIIYVSALAEVSKSQHRAAQIDGSSLFQRIKYIDLPSILPLYAVNLVFRCGAMLSNNYEKILLLQNNFNKEYSQVISTYTYEIAFKGLIPQYSLSTAIGIMTSLVSLAMLLIVKRATRKWERIDEK